MAGEDLDLVVHLGDYVYEYDVPADGGYRAQPVPDLARPAPQDVDQWRIRYALYKSDPALQAAHARFPWAVTWDDHEVRNDYAAEAAEGVPDLGVLRAAAYRAWYEHQPVRAPARPGHAGPRIFRRLHWGRLAQLDMLDGRQYRSAPPCGWGEAPACDAARDPSVTMLGAEQERWLTDGFAHSRARWNLLGNNVMLGRLDHDGPAGNVLWQDGWDGFPAARNRLTAAWQRHGVRNPVAFTGDWHSTFVNDIKRDFDDTASATVATEFVGTSLSSNGDREVYGPYYGPMIGYNPHIRFFDGDRRGYLRCSLRPDRLRVDLRMVDSVRSPAAAEYTLASFTVQDGRPGAIRA
jgi:alkaline phosphatase D